MSSTISSNVLNSPIVPYTALTVFGSPSSAPTVNSRVFWGYSTVNTDQNGKTQLFDISLVNRDLYNAFYSRVGERVMRPDWGCKIWEWLMEPMTQLLQDQIVAEVVRICNSDVRLSIVNIQVNTYQNGIRVDMTLNYLPFNVVNSFTVTFEQRQTAYFSNMGS